MSEFRNGSCRQVASQIKAWLLRVLCSTLAVVCGAITTVRIVERNTGYVGGHVIDPKPNMGIEPGVKRMKY